MNSQIKNWEQKQGVKFLSKVGVKKNFMLLDFGARVGHYSIPAAIIVGKKGKIYALDKNESALDELKEKSEKLSLENIEIIKTDGNLQTNFSDNYFDAVLLYDILHFLSKNQRKILFTEIFRILKKNGILSVYPKHINSDYPMKELENLTIRDIIREIEKFGLDFSEKICETISHDDSLNYGCVINFKKGAKVNKTEYADKIMNDRKNKDEFFKNHPQSPIPIKDKNQFKGLNYYEPDMNYRFILELKELEEKEFIKVNDSGGNVRDMLIWGEFHFKIGNTECSLQAYKSGAVEERLFVPFKDKTSGKETYGAGKYLDLIYGKDQTEDGKWILDFNNATNPWCAYSENYACPFVPPANWLDGEIKAGEKNYPLGY